MILKLRIRPTISHFVALLSSFRSSGKEKKTRYVLGLVSRTESERIFACVRSPLVTKEEKNYTVSINKPKLIRTTDRSLTFYPVLP